jgi:hypothetical protein
MINGAAKLQATDELGYVIIHCKLRDREYPVISISETPGYFLVQLLAVRIGDSTGQQVLEIEICWSSNAWHGDIINYD